MTTANYIAHTTLHTKDFEIDFNLEWLMSWSPPSFRILWAFTANPIRVRVRVWFNILLILLFFVGFLCCIDSPPSITKVSITVLKGFLNLHDHVGDMFWVDV